jgi:hypothetical protein
MQPLPGLYDDGAEARPVFERDDRVMRSAGVRGFDICGNLVIVEGMALMSE